MKTTITILALLLVPFFGSAQNVEKFSIDSGGATHAAGDIQIIYAFGGVDIQELAAGDILVSEGFINPLNLSISVNPKVFLQGPYMTPADPGLMNDDLRTILPTTSPYVDGLTCAASVFTTTGDDAIIDWIVVELRDATDRSIVIESRSALLQRDGDVVDVDGSSGVSFSSASGNYYVLVNHRNHLGVLSANPIALSGTTAVDLSTDPADVFNGVDALINMNGEYTLVSGDADSNGQIQPADIVLLRPQVGTAGYSVLDMDMNGQIQVIDINNIIAPNTGKGEQY